MVQAVRILQAYLVEGETAEDDAQAPHLTSRGTLVYTRGAKVDVVALHRHETLERKIDLKTFVLF